MPDIRLNIALANGLYHPLRAALMFGRGPMHRDIKGL